MEFIRENYIWIIVVAVVILMAIVGYVAEKTNFGKNKFTKQVKPKKQKNRIEPVEEEVLGGLEENDQNDIIEPIINEEYHQNDIIEPILNEENSEIIIEEDNQNNNIDSIEPVIEEVNNNEVIEPIEEDLNVPFGEENTLSNNEVIEPIEEDLNVPLTNTTINSEEVVSNDNEIIQDLNNNIEPIETNDLPLPDIDTLNNDDEEDVWKF